MGKQNRSIKSLNNIGAQIIIIKIIGQNFWPLQSCLQQLNAFINLVNIFFFANHGLHPKFDIQGVHKVMNPVAKDQAMWLVDVRVQLVYNLQEAQKRYKENVDEHQKEQPSFKVRDQVWLWQQHIKTTRPS